MGDLVWTGPTPSGTREPAPAYRPDGSETQVNRLDYWKEEIAESYKIMKEMTDMEATAVFRLLSQFSARASEIRSQIGPQEGKREAAFRIRIIDPFIEECDRQFKIHSRIQAINEMDARLAGGRFT